MEDDAVGSDRVVTLAEEAHAAAPSRATHTFLADALLLRAHRRLAKQQPDYARMESRVRQTLGGEFLIAVALERGGKLSAAVLADKDVRRACELLKEQATAFPATASPWLCVLVRAAHPAEGPRLLAALRKDEAGRLSRDVALKLAPTSASVALSSFWALKLEGKEAEGKAILKACAGRGVPLPFDLD